MKAGVVGIGRALPDKVVTNADFEARGLETTDDWIVKRTGIRERHHLEPEDEAGPLATEAAREALSDAGIDADELDLVVVTTITPDWTTPGLAPRVADDLGVGPGAVDLNGACAGFIYALDYASALIESERAGTVLVVSCDILSRITDFEDRSTAVLFGDGAGAAVLTGGDFQTGVTRAALGSDYRVDELNAPLGGNLGMNGRSVYTNAVDRMAEATRTVLEREGLTVDDLDLFVAHQANQRILAATARQLGISDEKLVSNVDKVANTSSASIPLALRDAETEGLLEPGMRIGLAAFGAGYVWGATVIGWKELDARPGPPIQPGELADAPSPSGLGWST